MNIRNRTELQAFLDQGHSFEYLFFWGHQKLKYGVTKSCFSQWYEASFESDGKTYPTAEHFMMAEKARLFEDQHAETKVLNAVTPKEAKQIGRSVNGFIEDHWLEKRFSIVVTANMAKFSQNKDLKFFLLETQDKVLVEASPVDRVWGIGLSADDPKASKPTLWKGDNLLGFALMEVRSQLRG